ncbi:uncharacterized protein MONOS_1272 [Monocercomonoides exilis]|uniref:uncharacterized protein n=1 Tax=Monocercomonoides exilis TaxID=2049356 RepID=UPI003559BA52|nr:hypothetical protein MONOS_1272 [Monocercomonoides exilis]|eukprot:MONOS_1272.1-p1 / transcript=MONOS_1272.1 / gene=MONOS_1272 / organism=Monocercomonoides_exilis_PA203 / gene_product=unspecified product / transcript_product=unspecified product / location=Mono_scaffold00022:13799-14793(-) / protein_length=245 / sequence_SO=supercontig / SO=protein_coding / is_pseudo=false
MARRCAFRMASAASTDVRVASAGMLAAAVESFVSELSEILEGVPVDGMNVAYGSALKACSSTSPPISKSAFNSDEDKDRDTLLRDKASSDEGWQAADFISQRISQFVVVGGAKERLAISSGCGSSSTSEATTVMRGGKRDNGKTSDYGDDGEDDESADDLAAKTRADLPDDLIKSGSVSLQLSPAVILPHVQLNDLGVQLKRMLKMPLQTLFVSTARCPLLPRGWMGSAEAALAMGKLQQTMFR